MITPKQKAKLLRDFLHSSFYCDLDVPRTREEVETIRDTMKQYKEWFHINVQNPPEKLTTLMNKAHTMHTIARDLVLTDDYADLLELKAGLESTRIASVNT